jgi:hypothetical protein
MWHFILLRLDKPAGVDLIVGAERGFLTPTSSDVNAEDRLLILQQSNAAPLKLAIGTVDSLDPPSHVHTKSIFEAAPETRSHQQRRRTKPTTPRERRQTNPIASGSHRNAVTYTPLWQHENRAIVIQRGDHH